MRNPSSIHDLVQNCNPQLNLKKFYTKLRFEEQYPHTQYYSNLFVVASILKKCYDESEVDEMVKKELEDQMNMYFEGEQA